MELNETCFLTNVNIAVCHYSVTLGGSDEHFTANGGISAYAKYSVSGSAVLECRKPRRNHDNSGIMMWAKAQDI